MKVLVTGGSGFIGSHTCLALVEKGYEVLVIDSYVNSNEESIRRVVELTKSNNKVKNVKIDIHNKDIRDELFLDKLFSDSQIAGKSIEAVIHFAGLKSVNESVINPMLYWDTNVNGSINLFKVMSRYQCKTIVFSSSATVYGLLNKGPITEKADINPINPYGRTKSVIEKILHDIFDSEPDKWKIANLRYFNPIGSHPSGMIGEAPNGIPNNIFPYITQVAAGIREKLTVFGNDWPTKDGTGVRDYIHVMDLAEAHILALEHLVKTKNQIINLNLGTGVGTSVLELVNTFERVNNLKIPLEFSSRREGDCSTVIAENALAIDSLNWSPKRNLEDMCVDGWKWQKLNPKGYK